MYQHVVEHRGSVFFRTEARRDDYVDAAHPDLPTKGSIVGNHLCRRFPEIEGFTVSLVTWDWLGTAGAPRQAKVVRRLKSPLVHSL